MPSTAWTLGRLHKTAEFERVRKEGARWRGRLCVLNAARALSFSTAELPGSRIGLITSKAVGGAVQRNRARRLMCEAVRALAAEGLTLIDADNGQRGDTQLLITIENGQRLLRFTPQGRTLGEMALPPPLATGSFSATTSRSP